MVRVRVTKRVREEYEDNWETTSEVSKTSKQMWASKQQQWDN
jgi:hypothetical protein